MSQVQTLESLAESLTVKNTFSISINSEYLDLNFSIIKQCLQKLHKLENQLGEQSSSHLSSYEELNQKVEQNSQKIDETDKKLKNLQQTIDHDLTAKFQELEERTRSTHDISKLIQQIQQTKKFITREQFSEDNQKIKEQLEQIEGFKSSLNRFIDHDTFKKFKDEFINNELNRLLSELNDLKEGVSQINNDMKLISDKAEKASQDAEQNNTMMKEINFNQMQQKLKKFKEQSEQRLGDFSMKLKKKAGLAEISEIQKNIIEKLDKVLGVNERLKADKDQTREALSFLENRLNELFEVFSSSKQPQENQALFATKKWMCASCSKDIGKYEGKLNQFKPWSVFPCKQLDPEKTGGFGYLNYVDKLAYKKGYSIDDTGIDRLNKTFFQRNNNSNSPKKLNSTRTTNFMNNYGQSERNTVSLKEEYFKIQEKTNKVFRVKKDLKKDLNNPEGEKERVKPQTSVN